MAPGDETTSPWLKDPRIGVRSHIEQFREGGSFLIPEADYKRFIEGQQMIGRADGQFITTRGAMDKLLEETAGDIPAINKRLSVNWSGRLYRVNIHDPLMYNARMPAGWEIGADPSLFRWGGYTKGGMPELIIDKVPRGSWSANPIGK